MSWIAVGVGVAGIAANMYNAKKQREQAGAMGGPMVMGTPKQMKTAYNQTQSSIKQQQDFVNAMQAQNGVGNQSNVFQQQQGLADQMQGVVNGTGPNPAQAALNQATGVNVANQAALMAGQRGAGANTGLIARQAGQQGGNIQQQAVGQGATLQAQQSLAAMGQLQAQQGQMGNLASQQVNQQQTGISNLGQQSLNQQSNLYGLQSGANAANAQMQMNNQNAQNQMFGNIMNATGTAVAALSNGGGGGAQTSNKMTPSGLGTSVGGAGNTMQAFAQGGNVGPKSYAAQHICMANGGKVPALVSPGEVYLKPQDVQQVAQGQKSPLQGETIPGQAKVKGAKNDYDNDTVPKTLEEGGIVIPRSITQSKNPEKKAHDFISAILAKNKHK